MLTINYIVSPSSFLIMFVTKWWKCIISYESLTELILLVCDAFILSKCYWNTYGIIIILVLFIQSVSCILRSKTVMTTWNMLLCLLLKYVYENAVLFLFKLHTPSWELVDIIALSHCVKSSEITRLVRVSRQICCNIFGLYFVLMHFFFQRDLPVGTELLLDYGDRSKEAVECNPWLKFWTNPSRW